VWLWPKTCRLSASSAFVKKKASLALLRLFRKFPEVLSPQPQCW
jgi:hypothetical protein